MIAVYHLTPNMLLLRITRLIILKITNALSIKEEMLTCNAINVTSYH